MRLLKATTLEFQVFNDSDPPPYVILSHTWRDKQEVSFQEMCWLRSLQSIPPALKSSDLYSLFLSMGSGAQMPATEEEIVQRSGYEKIINTARITRELGYSYCWIDTICIDKTSSSELQEAINSMYRWYQKSTVCLVYLDDAAPADIEKIEEVVTTSKWVTRGWTLQELIAPTVVLFYDATWRFLCEKHDELLPLARATKVPADVLATGDLDNYCIAQRMSWAAERSTSRVEDRAYCLLGIFDIHMPMLYGEGEKAFTRLQEEILKTYADDSILAWEAPDDHPSVYRGLLARSPSEFLRGAHISRGEGDCPIYTSSLGINLNLDLEPIEHDKGLFQAILNARSSGEPIGILLRRLSSDQAQYARVRPHELLYPSETTSVIPGTIYARQKLSVPRGFVAPEMFSFIIRFLDPPWRSLAFFMRGAWPREAWSADSRAMKIPKDVPTFIGIIWVGYNPSEYVRDRLGFLQEGNEMPRDQSFQLVLGFDREKRRCWCKILAEPFHSLTTGLCEAFLEGQNWDACEPEDFLNLSSQPDAPAKDVLFVTMESGIFDDKISFVVNISIRRLRRLNQTSIRRRPRERLRPLVRADT